MRLRENNKISTLVNNFILEIVLFFVMIAKITSNEAISWRKTDSMLLRALIKVRDLKIKFLSPKNSMLEKFGPTQK